MSIANHPAQTSAEVFARGASENGVVDFPQLQKSPEFYRGKPVHIADGTLMRLRDFPGQIPESDRKQGIKKLYLGWVFGRDELLAQAQAVGLGLRREFVLPAWLSAAGAPEDPVEHRALLFG